MSDEKKGGLAAIAQAAKSKGPAGGYNGEEGLPSKHPEAQRAKNTRGPNFTNGTGPADDPVPYSLKGGKKD